MHKVQAEVLRDIITYIQDKTGKEPELVLDETVDNKLILKIYCVIGRDYPAMKEG